jgi:hypothetical protein
MNRYFLALLSLCFANPLYAHGAPPSEIIWTFILYLVITLIIIVDSIKNIFLYSKKIKIKKHIFLSIIYSIFSNMLIFIGIPALFIGIINLLKTHIGITVYENLSFILLFIGFVLIPSIIYMILRKKVIKKYFR